MGPHLHTELALQRVTDVSRSAAVAHRVHAEPRHTGRPDRVARVRSGLGGLLVDLGQRLAGPDHPPDPA